MDVPQMTDPDMALTLIDVLAMAVAKGDVFTILAIMGVMLWKLWKSAEAAKKDHQELVVLVKSGQEKANDSLSELSSRMTAIEASMSETRTRHTDVMVRLVRLEDAVLAPRRPVDGE